MAQVRQFARRLDIPDWLVVGARLFRRSVAEFLEDGCLDYAASVTFHLLLSVFPLAILLAAGFSQFVAHSASERSDAIKAILNALPLSASGQDQVRSLLRGSTAGSGAFTATGAVALVWAATGVMAALRSALDRAWDVSTQRPFLRGKLFDLGMLLAAVAGFSVVTALVVIGHVSQRLTIAGVSLPSAITGALAPAALTWMVVVALYRVVPARKAPLRSLIFTATLVVAGMVILEHAFAFYLGHFAQYNRIYGTLGALVALLFFLYLSTALVLWGAELAAEIDRKHCPHSGRGVSTHRQTSSCPEPPDVSDRARRG